MHLSRSIALFFIWMVSVTPAGVSAGVSAGVGMDANAVSDEQDSTLFASNASFRHIYAIHSDKVWYEDHIIHTTFDPETETVYAYLTHKQELIGLHPDGRLERLGTLQTRDRLPLNLEVLPGGRKLLLWATGLGPVYEFDLQSAEFTRIDQSRLNMYAFGHAAALDQTGVLHAVGGYGYWEKRNRLLYFDRNTKGWELVTVGDVKPLPFTYGMMFFIPEQNSFLLASPVTDQSTLYYQVTTFDNTEKIWTRPRFHKIIDESITILDTDIGFSNHRMNPEDGLVYVINGLFYDVNRDGFYVQRPEPGTDKPLRGEYWTSFYSQKRKSWVRVGFLNSQTELALVYETFTPQDLVKVSRRVILPTRFRDPDGTVLYSHDPLTFLVWTACLLVGVILTGGVYIAHTSIQRKSMVATPRLRIIRTEGGVERVAIGDRLIPMEDAALRNLMELLAELKTNNVNALPLVDLDERLYPRQVNATVTGKSRNRLIEYINSELGSPLLNVQRSSFDRRFRVLNIELASVQVSDIDTP